MSLFLSTVETAVLCEQLGIARLPYPLGVPGVGFDPGIVDEAWAGLTDRGLAGRTRVAEEVAGLLRRLARPMLGVDAIGDVGQPLRALAVSDGAVAAAAMLTEDGLTMTEIRPTALAATLVDLLPAAPPGPGHAFNFPHKVLAAAVAAEESDAADLFFGDGEHNALVRAGMAGGDARLLAELVEGRLRGGQFGITTWHRSSGAGARHPALVTWFDTHSGRYLVVRERGWVSVAPAGPDRIAARVEQALAAAVGNH